VYTGKNKVVHARTKGVVEEDILSFLRTDYIFVVRLDVGKQAKERAIKRAQRFVGKDYDFLFETTDDERLYCSELVKKAYEEDLQSLGEGTIPPDNFLSLPNGAVIHDSREYRK
jgi:uncharacterized protein YycO